MHLLISWKGFSDVSPHSCPTALGENSPKWSQKRWERSLWEVGGGRWEVGFPRVCSTHGFTFPPSFALLLCLHPQAFHGGNLPSETEGSKEQLATGMFPKWPCHVLWVLHELLTRLCSLPLTMQCLGHLSAARPAAPRAARFAHFPTEMFPSN